MRLPRPLRRALPVPLLAALSAAPSCADVNASPDFKVGTHVDDWRDEIIYQVLIDRFADGDLTNDYRVNRAAPARYHGGDWRGLAEKLDYIQALGVTTLWISPIVKNVETDAGIDSYHGYWAQDPAYLNPHFGNLNDLRDLVGRAHARKIKVVLDIVTNHMGQLFFYDINQNGRPDENIEGGLKSPTKHITEYDPDYEVPEVQSFTSLGPAGPAPVLFLNDPSINRIPPSEPLLRRPEAYHRRGRIVNYDREPDGTEQTLFGDFPGGLKDLATERDDVRQLLIEIYGRWIELADFDGFRIDTVKHVEHEFWQVFDKAIRAKAASLGKKNFLLFGEVFDGREPLVGGYTKNGELDTLFDFPQYFQVFRDVFAAGGPTKKVEARYAERKREWGAEAHPGGIGSSPYDAHVNFLDNHDVGRFLWVLRDVQRRADAPQALRNALTMLLTQDGIPCVYYGTEQDYRGGNDPANREDLWLSGYKTDGATFKHLARLTRIRKAYAPLRRGTMTFTFTTDHTAAEDDAGILAFERTMPDWDKASADGKYALVVINTNAKTPATPAATMKVNAPAGTVLFDVLPTSGGQELTVGSEGKLPIAPMAPTSAMVLVPKGTRI